MPDEEAVIEYWLATTAIQFTGTRTTTTYRDGSGEQPPSVIADATQVLRADRAHGPVRFDVARSLFAKSQSTLRFTDDGRLTGGDQSRTGRGPAVLGAVAKVAGTAIQIGAAMAAFLRQTPDATPPEFPDEALLLQLTDRLHELTQSVADLPSDGSGDAKALLDYSERAIKLLTAQRTALEKAKADWTESVVVTTTHSYALQLDLAQLPTEAELTSSQLHPAAQAVWDSLQIMVTVPAYDLSTDPLAKQGGGYHAPYSDDADQALWYRRPRRTTLSVWKAGTDGTPELVSTSECEVVDEDCRHFSVRMDREGPIASAFSTHELSVTFGALGTPTSIGTKADPGAAEALTAVAGAPDAFTAGFTSAKKAGALFAPPDPVAQEIAALTAQKKLRKLRADVSAL